MTSALKVLAFAEFAKRSLLYVYCGQECDIYGVLLQLSGAFLIKVEAKVDQKRFLG